MSKKYPILLVFFCMCVAKIYAQQEIPLRRILSDIEKEHHVKFSFLEEEIAPFQLFPPLAKWPLPQKLAYLAMSTGLAFETVSPGYVSVWQKAKNAAEPDHPVALEEVAIAQYLATGISMAKDGASVIKPKKMELLPGLAETDVLQAMQQLPGIYSADESISNLNIRCGTHDQNLFLWNGIRMFQTGHFFGLISAFNPNITDEVRVYKNGTSAFYGESVSATVALSAQAKKTDEYASGISSSLMATEFHTVIELENGGVLLLSGRRSLTDFFRSPTYQNYYDRIFQNTVVTRPEDDLTVHYRTKEDFYFADFSVQYEQKVGKKHRFALSLLDINNKLDVTESLVLNGPPSSKASHLSQQSAASGLEWKSRWSQNHSSELQFYFSGYLLDSHNNKIEADQSIVQKNSVADMGFKLRDDRKFGENLTFSSGYQYNETGIRNNDSVNHPLFNRKTRKVLRIHAGVGELSYNRNQFRVKGGLRVAYITEFDRFLFEPRLTAGYAVSNDFSVNFLGERKGQTTSQVVDLQRDFLGIEKRRWVLADDHINPIPKSSQAELGLTFHNDKWVATLNTFYKKVNGISSGSQAFQNQLEFIRITGDYTVYGTEFLLQRSLEHFKYWASYSFNKSNYFFPLHFPSEFRNSYEIAHSVNFAALFQDGGLGVALGGKWDSGRPETRPLQGSSAPFQGQIAYQNPNALTLRDYFQMNFSASYSLSIGKSRLTMDFSLMNLLGNHNLLSRYYRVNRAIAEIEKVDTYGIKRSPNCSVKLAF